MIKLQYSRMLQDALDGEHGLPRTKLKDLSKRFPPIHREVAERRRGGE